MDRAENVKAMELLVSWNKAGFMPAEPSVALITALVNEGKAEPDPEARLAIYGEAERIIQEDVGYMPIVYRVDQCAFKPWVKDVAVNRQGYTVPEGNIYNRMLATIDVEGRPAE